jgi:hypothetical protein
MPGREGHIMTLESGQSLLCDLDVILPALRDLVANGEVIESTDDQLPADWDDRMDELVGKLVDAIRLAGKEPR